MNIDMILCVAWVKAAVDGQLPLSVFESVFVRDYLAQLNPKHHPPYQLEHIHIIECMIDYVKERYSHQMSAQEVLHQAP
jgi:hypothetical protein